MKRAGLLAYGRKVGRVKKVEFWIYKMEEEAMKVEICDKRTIKDPWGLEMGKW